MNKLFILGNGADWCETSLKGLCDIEGVSLINYKMPINNPFIRKIAHFHFSQRVNALIKLPLKRIWYEKINKQLKIDLKGRNCLLIFDHNVMGRDEQFLQFIRKKEPDIILAYIFTNFVRGSSALAQGYVDKLTKMYDLVFAFDPLDQKKYGFLYSPLIYDPIPGVSTSKNNYKDTAFYIGQAKDRLPILLSIYEKIESMGIKTDFNIVNVARDNIKHQERINFNHPITYNEVLKHISRCSCIIDGIQGGSTGLTIKTCEAVCYHKKLITTNKNLADYDFYDPRYMLIIDKAEDITADFFTNNRNVRYSDEAVYFFSGKRFWNQIWSEISKKDKSI